MFSGRKRTPDRDSNRGHIVECPMVTLSAFAFTPAAINSGRSRGAGGSEVLEFWLNERRSGSLEGYGGG